MFGLSEQPGGTWPDNSVALAAPSSASQSGFVVSPKNTWRSVTFEPLKPVPVIVKRSPPVIPDSAGSIIEIVGAAATVLSSGTHIVPIRCVPVPHVVSVRLPPVATHAPPIFVVPVPHVVLSLPQAARAAASSERQAIVVASCPIRMRFTAANHANEAPSDRSRRGSCRLRQRQHHVRPGYDEDGR